MALTSLLDWIVGNWLQRRLRVFRKDRRQRSLRGCGGVVRQESKRVRGGNPPELNVHEKASSGLGESHQKIEN